MKKMAKTSFAYSSLYLHDLARSASYLGILDSYKLVLYGLSKVK